MEPLRIAVTGRSGQIAQALIRRSASRGIFLEARGRPDLDIRSIDSVGNFLASARPTVLVNAAAYTAVDKAESEPDQAQEANAEAPALLATLCEYFALPLIHLSTDYVFDGTARTPYKETDPISPLSVYGTSKAVGEAAVRSIAKRHIIVRTSWIYSPDGSNFVKTMLRLGGERDVLRVVDDQTGSPTWADDIAGAILDIAHQITAGAADGAVNSPWGTYHLTGSGQTTWHQLAAEIFRLSAARGLKVPALEAIPTEQYPTPAHRPAYSVLDNSKIARTFGIRLPPWRESLDDCVARIVSGTGGPHP